MTTTLFFFLVLHFLLSQPAPSWSSSIKPDAMTGLLLYSFLYFLKQPSNILYDKYISILLNFVPRRLLVPYHHCNSSPISSVVVLKLKITLSVPSVLQVITIAVLVLYTEQCLPLATCLCVMEINSVFLHFRRLMHFHGGNRSHFEYKLNLLALFATFVALRFVFLVLLTAYFIYNRHMVPLNIFVAGSFGFMALIVINLILFFRVCKTEFMVKASRNKEQRNGFVKEKFN